MSNVKVSQNIEITTLQGEKRLLTEREIHFIQSSKYLKYNKKTGVFTRKKRYYNFQVIGEEVGINENGYISVPFKGLRIRAHSLAWLFVYGYIPERLDHKNEIRDDNRLVNLREVTHQENLHNISKPNKNSTTKVRGVILAKDKHGKPTGKYVSNIKVNNKIIRLGTFNDIDSAKLAYLKAKSDYHPCYIHK